MTLHVSCSLPSSLATEECITYTKNISTYFTPPKATVQEYAFQLKNVVFTRPCRQLARACANLEVLSLCDTSLELWLAAGGGVLHVLIIKRLNGPLGLNP